MATSTTLLVAGLAHLLGPEIDWIADDVRLALLSSAYVPSDDHAVFADVAAAEISGTGYTAGGQALTGKALAIAGDVVTCAADPVVFAALTATFRYGILYRPGTVGGVTGPLIGLVTLDTEDVVVAGEDYPVNWMSGGPVRLVVGTV